MVAESEDAAQEAIRVLERTAAGEDVAKGFTPDKLEELKALRESMQQNADAG